MLPYGVLRRNKYICICKIRRFKKIILSSYSKTASDNRNKHTDSSEESMVEDISLSLGHWSRRYQIMPTNMSPH